MSRKMTLMRLGQYCSTHLCKKCPIKAMAEQHHHDCPECLRIPEIAETAELLITGANLKDDFTYSGVRYTVYDRATDEAIVYGGTARECARKMKITIDSFYSLYSRQKNGSDRASGKWEIFRDDEE